MDKPLSKTAIEALKMLAEEPRVTWRCNLVVYGWVGGRTAACLIRRGLAQYKWRSGPEEVYKNPDKIWDYDRKVEITEAGRDALRMLNLQISAEKFNLLSLKQRVDRMKAMIESGEIAQYAKVINSRYPHPHGLIGYLGDEVRYFNPEAAKNIDSWFE